MVNETATEQALSTRFLRDQRELRARRFANYLLNLLRPYIADANREETYRLLYAQAFGNNLELVSIPPELDAQKWLELERLKLTPIPPIIKQRGS